MAQNDVGRTDRVEFTVTDLSPTKVGELIADFLRAVERFRAQESRLNVTVHGNAEDLAKAALFEALNWADTIDWYLRNARIKREPEETPLPPPDKLWATKLPEDQRALAAGFQHARNRVHHQWWRSIGVRIHSGGDPLSTWVWAQLPKGELRGKHEIEGFAAYRAALEGRHMLTTLDGLAAIFWEKRGHAITRKDLMQPGHTIGSPLKFDGE